MKTLTKHGNPKRTLLKLLRRQIERQQTMHEIKGLPRDVIVGMDRVQSIPPDALYADHAYFRRGWSNDSFRLVRGGIHLTRIIKPKSDRLTRLGASIQPYRKTGRHIVAIVPGNYIAFWMKIEGLLASMLAEVRKHTGRPVRMQTKGQPLGEALTDAWAVVCPVSVAGVEAAMAGIPVFSTPRCPTWPINAGPLSAIETPMYHDREDWAQSLAGATWLTSEVADIDFKHYQQ